MYVEIIIGIILIYVALRALITENRVSKLLYLNLKKKTRKKKKDIT